MIKPVLRQIEADDGLVIVDDTMEEKPSTDQNEIVCWHDDHSQGRNVKGINLVNVVSHRDFRKGPHISLPVAFEVVSKPDPYVDPKTHTPNGKAGVPKTRSSASD